MLDVTYKLDLRNTKIHPRFHILLLEPAAHKTLVQDKIYVATEHEYKVKIILDYRGTTPNEEYFVKWKGYNSTENT